VLYFPWAYVQYRVVLMQGLCGLDVCLTSRGLCAFDVNRTCRAAFYLALYEHTRVVLPPTLWALNINRNRCTSLYESLYLMSQVVLLPGVWTLDVCWPIIGLCAFGVNRTRCAA